MRWHKQTTKNLENSQRDEIGSEEFNSEVTDDWQEKARRLQARRWHKIRRQEMHFR